VFRHDLCRIGRIFSEIGMRLKMVVKKISVSVSEEVYNNLNRIFEELKKTDFNLKFSQVANKILSLGIQTYDNEERKK